MKAFDIIREELPKFFNEPQAQGMVNAAQIAKEALVPQSVADLGLMLATGPFGKATKLGGAGLAGMTASDDAEAGGIPLKSAWAKFFKTNPDNYNAVVAALRKSAPKHEAELQPLNTWDELLSTDRKVPRNKSSLRDYTQTVAPPDVALRVQANPELDLGQSYTKGWLGTHFDTSGGAQIPDVVSNQKRLRPTDLPEQFLHAGIIDPKSRGVVASDFMANMPRLDVWRNVTGSNTAARNAEELADALRQKDLNWISYPNTFEGHTPAKRHNIQTPYAAQFGEVALPNASTTLLTPNAIQQLSEQELKRLLGI